MLCVLPSGARDLVDLMLHGQSFKSLISEERLSDELTKEETTSHQEDANELRLGGWEPDGADYSKTVHVQVHKHTLTKAKEPKN